MKKLFSDLPIEMELNIDRYRKFLSNFIEDNYIVTITDIDGNIKYINDQFVKISGYSKEELIGANQKIVNSGYHKIDFWQTMWLTIKSGQSWKDIICNKNKNGNLYWVKTNIIPIMDEQNKIIEFLSFRKDVTKEILNIKELEQSQMFYKESQKIAKVGYWELFPKTNELFWDDITKEIHEVPQDFKPNLEDAVNFYDGEAKNIIQSIVNDALKSGDEWNIQLPFITAKGRSIWVRAIGKVILNQNGTPERIYGIFRDETEAREIQQKFFEQEALRNEISSKQHFFSKMSNQLRSPINALIGLTNVLSQNESNPNQKALIEHIKETQSELLNLVSDIVEIADIDDRKIKISRIKFDLVELLNRISHTFKEIASKKNISLNFSFNKHSIDCYSDQSLISKCISTLLKFYITESPDYSDIHVLIDTREEKAKVSFKYGSRSTTSMSNKYFINHPSIELTKHSLFLLNGECIIEEDLSISYIEFPINFVINDENSNYINENSANTKNKNILIVEDISTNQKVIQLMLEKLNIKCDVADNGEEAINLCKSKSYSHIIMDIHMPTMDGIEATKKIRSFNSQVKIIGLSAKAISEFDFKSVGFNNFITKPIQFSTLEQLTM